MRRVVALTSLALLAACGSQDVDPGTGGAVIAEQSGTAERVTAKPENVAESEESVDDYGDGDYVEEESSDQFGEPMSDGEADFADASAPMDDAQGIDPHADVGDGEYSEDY